MKKLNVKAVVIDLRHVSEETLASYEHIQIHAALAMTSPRTELCWQSIRWSWMRPASSAMTTMPR